MVEGNTIIQVRQCTTLSSVPSRNIHHPVQCSLNMYCTTLYRVSSRRIHHPVQCSLKMYCTTLYRVSSVRIQLVVQCSLCTYCFHIIGQETMRASLSPKAARLPHLHWWAYSATVVLGGGRVCLVSGVVVLGCTRVGRWVAGPGCVWQWKLSRPDQVVSVQKLEAFVILIVVATVVLGYCHSPVRIVVLVVVVVVVVLRVVEKVY